MNRSTLFLLVIVLNACAHQPATWQRSKQAAYDAAVHPSVWAPLLGAGIFAMGNLDGDTSKNLSDHPPVFGNSHSAAKVGDDLQDVLVVTAAVSALMVPGSEDKNTVADRGDHLAVAVGGIALTGAITETVKKITKRERPDKSNNNSFPSGHASGAFAAATFASENFHERWGNSAGAQWADASLYTAASLTALSRVEAEKHYPSDVLVGAALGSFVARFLDELLLKNANDTSLVSFYDGKTLMIGIEQKF